MLKGPGFELKLGPSAKLVGDGVGDDDSPMWAELIDRQS